MESSRRAREIKLEVPEDVHRALEELSRREGYESVDKLVHAIVVDYLKHRHEDSFERMKVKLERYLQDELNKRLAGVETLRRQVSELYEEVDSIKHRVEALESAIKATTLERRQARPPGKSAIERLKDEKILFESKLPPQIQRDRLFSYFERAGAIVLKLERERVAVDQEFWEEFKRKLESEVTTNREDEIASILGEKGYKLWKALYSDNLIIFDPKTKRWRFIHNEMP